MEESFKKATPRKKCDYLYERLGELKQKRAPWLSRWIEVAEYVSPYSARKNVNDHLEGRNYDYIYDNEAGRSLGVLASGLASGATSPARQWFKIKPQGFKEASDVESASWCTEVERVLLETFHKSNTYNSLHALYTELCLFGVGACLVYEDENNIIRHHVLTAGDYCLQANSKGEIDTIYREFEMTVAQAVEFFGYDNLSKDTQKFFDRGELDKYLTYCHAIEPRSVRDRESISNKDMPYASYYFRSDEKDHEIVHESGFKYFPALCPRWNVLAGNVYGISPAITSLPNVKQLQVETKVKLEILEQLANPPLQAPATASQSPIQLTAGAINFTTSTGQEQQIRPIIAGVGDISSLSVDINNLKQDIRRDFFVDIFLMIQNQLTDRKTATEIQALREEKMLVLGSVMERLQQELLSPLLTITYSKLLERGYIPTPPAAIANHTVDIEFQSLLAQSQRAIDINAIDRMISSMQAISASKPEVLDRLDADGLFDVYRDRLAVDPKIARSREDAEALRQQRAQMQQQAMQAEQATAAGATINQLAQAQRAGADASLATQKLQQVAQGGEIV